MYLYVPQRPTHLKKWMPRNTDSINWSWIKEALPSFDEAKRSYRIHGVLITPSVCTLIRLPLPNQMLKKAHNRLLAELKDLIGIIGKRNGKYNLLDPKVVPCSTNT